MLVNDQKTWKKSVLELSGYITYSLYTDGGREKEHLQWVRPGLTWYDEQMQPHTSSWAVGLLTLLVLSEHQCYNLSKSRSHAQK